VRALPDPFAMAHGAIGAALEALVDGGVRLIVLDVVLPDRSYDHLRPGLDLALFRGLRRARDAGLVVALQPQRGGVRTVHPPFVEAAGAPAFGFALYPQDADGVVRRHEPALGAGGEKVPTLVGLAAERLQAPAHAGAIEWALGAPLDYLPLHEVAAGRHRERVRGRVVVVGTVESFHDRVPQPLNLAAWEGASATPPGVLLHAQALRTLLHGGMLRPAPAWTTALGIALGAALGALRAPVGRWLALALLLVGLAAAATWARLHGWQLVIAAAGLAGGAAVVVRSAIDAWWHRRERLRLTQTFGGYVSPQVLAAILDGRLAAREGRDRLAFLFADLRGFSGMSERLPPEDVLQLLNRYYAAVTPAIHRHGGTIDNFRGDGIMVMFGAPEPLANPAAAALAAGRALLAAVDELNEALAREGAEPLVAGVGVACGPAVFGDLGSADRKDYTAIGDAVVVAARLQDLARDLGFRLVATRQAIDEAGLADAAHAGFVSLGERTLKGHRAPVAVCGWTPAP
jgi:class 3 adenylate cyclase